MTPLEFLTLLWQYKPDDQYVLLWTWPDKRSRWFKEIPATADAAELLGNGERDVYVGVGLAAKDHGPVHRCPSEEITGICGIGADFDVHSDAHSSKALPKSVEQALQIVPPALPPSVVVATGNGVHVWWLFKEPLIFDSDEERKHAQKVLGRFHTYLRHHAAAHGWAYDRLSDLARILRIPGTRNMKDPQHPKEVRCLSQSEIRYNLGDIDEVLDSAGIPDPEAEEKAAREWAERFAGTTFKIDLSARLPQEMIDGWCANDPRFKRTWERQRTDMEDQSRSAYDMALADFGVDSGLPVQMIVDLIIHHRAHHHLTARTKVDYFQRTISKAMARTIPPPPVCSASSPPPAATAIDTQGAAVPPPSASSTNGASPPLPKDPVAARGMLCDYLSKVLGVRIIQLVKYKGKDPTFHMLVEGDALIEFKSIEDVLSQHAVAMAIAAATGKINNAIKPKDWHKLKQTIMDACFEVEGDIQEEFVGSAREYVAAYLDQNGFIEDIASEKVANRHLPIKLNGNVAITSRDLKRFINKADFQNFSIKAVASMLNALGAKQVRHCGRGFKEQSRWLLPVDEFDPKDYPGGVKEEKPDDGW